MISLFKWFRKQPDSAPPPGGPNHDKPDTDEEIQRAASRVVGELRQLAATIEHASTRRPQAPRIENYKLAVEIATLVIVLAYTVITGCLLYTTNQTLKAALDANDIARKQHRPWVNVSLSLAGPLYLNAGGAITAIKISAKNGGDLPALHVKAIPHLAVAITAQDAVERRRLVCDDPKQVETYARAVPFSMLGSGSPLLLPNETGTPQTINLGIGRRDFKLTSNRLLSAVGDPKYLIRVWVTGCVVYLDGFGSPHATLFNFSFFPTKDLLSTDMLTMKGATLAGVLQPDQYGNDAY